MNDAAASERPELWVLGVRPGEGREAYLCSYLEAAGYQPRLGDPDSLAAGRPLGVVLDISPHATDGWGILLRIKTESCRSVASAVPATGGVNPNDPAAYKPRTQFDNTPWRFNMTQNGKRMTADEFDAWMKSRGVRVVGRKDGAEAAAPAPAPEAKAAN